MWSAVASAGTIGDGNGQIGAVTDSNGNLICTGCLDQSETALAFQELSLAGFIIGDYIHGGSSTISVGSFFYPKAPISIVNGANLAAPIYSFVYQNLGVPNAISKNTFNISDITFGSGNNHGGGDQANLSGAIKPSDALAIDLKIDDGAPNTGYVRGLDNPAGVTLCVNGSNNYDVADDSNGGSCISSFLME